LVGAIEEMDGNSWSVEGRAVMLTGSTVVTLAAAPRAGNIVFIEWTLQDDGSILASRVMAGVDGQVESISLAHITVENVDVLVPASAEVLADPASVGTIYVEGSVVNGNLVAERITEGARGTLESIVGSTWTIGATSVEVPPGTMVEEGADVVGSDILVSVTRGRDGTLVAAKVALGDVEPLPDGALPAEEISSPLVGSATYIVSSWSISGASGLVFVDSDTNIELGTDQVGLTVLVGYEPSADGSQVAREIRTP
jgi:hypothetical protein